MAKWEEAPIIEPEQRPAWEQAPITRASFGERAMGAVVKGEMQVAKAVLSAPAMAVKQYGLVRQADIANAVLREPDPERQAMLRNQMADSKQAFDKVANWLNKPAELHDIGRKIIEQNHPEWESDPPKGFVDLLTSPDKLGIAIAESAPILVNAGILTLAGQPQLATALMYVAEGQQAYDQAIQDGASEDDAVIAYVIYGSVSAALEKMQLEGILKVTKGSYNVLLNRTVQKVASRGLGSATWDIIKVAAQEGLEEMSQGTWQEITAKLVYDKSVPDGVAGFIDRRAQEAYLGFMLGLIPGVAGGVAGAVKGRGQVQAGGEAPPKPTTAPDATPVGQTQVDVGETTPETLTGAAIRLKSGEMLTGTTHANILREVEASGRTITNEEFDIPAGSGFVTNTGEFVSPKEAWKIADKAGQIKKDEIAKELVDKKYLIAEGVDFEKGEQPKKYTGKAYRNEVGLVIKGKTVADVVRFEQEELGNQLGITPEKLTEFENIPSDRVVWVARDKETAAEYVSEGEKADVQDYTEIVKGGEILAEIPDGVLVLKPEPKQPPPKPPLIKKGQTPITQEERKQLHSMGMTIAEIGKTPVSELRQKLGVEEPKPIAELVEPTKPTQPRMSRRKALKLGHQLPKKMGWDEAKRRDFMQQLIGKPSMKGMTPKEMKTLVLALQGKAREVGVLPPEDYQKTLFIGTREVKTDKFFDGVLSEIDKLKDKGKKKPKVITRRGQKRKRGLLKTAKDITVGVDNLNIPHLIRKIGGAVDGLLKEVGVTNYRRSIHRISSVYRGAVELLKIELDKAGVTAKDLAEMSLQLDPRLALIQRGRELVGKPKTKQYTIKLNGRNYQLSMAELIDIYLCAQQEKGMGHIEKAGLKIFGVKTGAITKEQLQPMLGLVKANPKAMAFANAVIKIATEYIAPQLNYTYSRLNPEAIEKLADEINYWHLNVDQLLRIKGKGTYSISLLENKNILKPRKGPKGALIVGDAFSKFFSVQYAVAEYVGMAEQLRLLNMVLNYEPVMEKLESKGYGDIRNNLKQLIEWVQDSKSTAVRSDKLVSKILHGAYRAVLHYSPEVILSQYMSTGHYAGVIDPKYVPLLSVPPTKSLIKEMLEHNPVVWTRYYAGGQSAELAETGQLDSTLRLLTGKHADLNKTGITAQLTDLAAFAQGWKLAKVFVKDTTQLKEGTPEFFDAVNDKAEELWDTQPSWDKWNKSISTSQRGIKRLPFLFRSYFEKSLMMLSTANATYEASAKTVADRAKQAQVYGAVIGSQMATALIRTFIGHVLWRKRKSVWDYVAAMVAAPLVMVSVVGGYMNRVVGNVFRILAGEKQQYQGEPISNLATDTLEDFFKGIGQTTKAAAYYLAGEEDKAEVQIKAATRNLVISIGTMKGVPVRQIEKINKAIETEDVPKHSGGYID